MSAPRETIAAIATPPGRGGVGIVRVSGPAVEAVAAAIVGKRIVPRMATLASFHGQDGEALDQGLALLFRGPHSYTGEDVLELHGHGGPAVLRLILARCLEAGARLAAPGEFTQRAFLNGKLDLAQAEAVADLIDAATATAARAAARSLSGEFSRAVRAVVMALTEQRMQVEAAIDFPDEDLDFVHAADVAGRLDALRAGLATLLRRAQQGALLREGLTVVLIGRPNVGKSSLMNRLTREDIAIVTDVAGTTRDALRGNVEIHGIPITFIDTAGLRPTVDPIETLGIERTWTAIAQANLALLVVDAAPGGDDDATGDDAAAAERAILARLPPALPRIVAHNKIDLAAIAPHRSPMRLTLPTEVWLSAKTGEGLTLLETALLEAVGAHEAMEGAFLARERHLEALRRAAQHLMEAAGHLDPAAPALELLAEELRLAQQALNTITGEFGADDLLGVIFSRFCIGK